MTYRVYSFEVPFPPSTNTYWRHVMTQGRPRTLISKRGRAYRDVIKQAVYTQVRSRSFVTIRDAVHMEIDLFPPDRRRRDVDNYCKALLDALTHAGFWADDSLVERLTISRRAVGRHAAAVIKITVV